MDKFIDENYELIYNKINELFPDVIHSDFYLEDIDVWEFVENYMKEEYELWKEKQQ